MRLTDLERKTIKKLAEMHFGEGCVVRLFGSRVDDSARGGDIDLHLEPDGAGPATFRQEIAFQAALREALGDQKVDVVIRRLGRPPKAFDRIALSQGVRL